MLLDSGVDSKVYDAAMHTRFRIFTTNAILSLSLAATAHAQHPAMPPGISHDEHLKQLHDESDLKKRGAAAMGFDQDATTHHFTLTSDGGRIEVTVNDPSDTRNVTRIRAHLNDIATAFERGDFGAPFATHDEVPAGVPALQQLRNAIRYHYENTPNGGRVVIASADPRARAAIHDFLRYQIREHATGDRLTVGK